MSTALDRVTAVLADHAPVDSQNARLIANEILAALAYPVSAEAALARLIEREYDAAAAFDGRDRPAPLALARVILASGTVAS